ncbi:MAG: hypothetical protein QXX18_05885 [Candidatus Jordarchaeales archaeon]
MFIALTPLILLLLMVIVPVVFIILFAFIFVRLVSEPVVLGYRDEWMREKSRKQFSEPFRWVSPGGRYSRGATGSQPLDEVKVYKELANYVSRMCYEGRISPETRDRVVSELRRVVGRLESGQDEDSNTSS